MPEFRKLLVANRSEIAIRVFRSAHELGIRTVAIYSHEDRFALHRFKADEAYLVGKPGEPIRAYLDIDGDRRAGAASTASTRSTPATASSPRTPSSPGPATRPGIIFVGPRAELLEQLGDKIAARQHRRAGRRAGPVRQRRAGRARRRGRATLAEKLGYPVIVKAADGRRRPRHARRRSDADELRRGPRAGPPRGRQPPSAAPTSSSRSSSSAPGTSKCSSSATSTATSSTSSSATARSSGGIRRSSRSPRPRTSTRRCAQRISATPPSPIGRAVGYDNAGTVEFLVDADTGEFYFIEVNPRIQVEHTVTEEVTGVDIVKSQILIAQGVPLDDPEIGLRRPGRRSAPHGFAIQCRVTTEDPANNFMPDYGRITHYRSASGMGIRLDAGTAFTGRGHHAVLRLAAGEGDAPAACGSSTPPGGWSACLQEFRVRGVKTNIPFLHQPDHAPDVPRRRRARRGSSTRRRSCSSSPRAATGRRKLLTYIGDVIVNGNPASSKAGRRRRPPRAGARPAVRPRARRRRRARADRFQELGPEKFAQWVREQKPLLLTDTTFRDAHQSLLATRLRTYDMLRDRRRATPRTCRGLFSLEMWGGATFDTSMRFLKESPWERLAELREQIPNILFQMLLRAANAVGYTNYPDNVVQAFVKEAAARGHRPLPHLRRAQLAAEHAARHRGRARDRRALRGGHLLHRRHPRPEADQVRPEVLRRPGQGAGEARAPTCWPSRTWPACASRTPPSCWSRRCSEEVGIPIHFHTHDIGRRAGGVASCMAAEEGVDIADGAMAPMSG